MTANLWGVTKKSLLPVILTVVCLVAVLPFNSPVLAAPPPFSGGSGTNSNPYIIANEADLDSMATYYLNL